ncbi:hypothetical protein [Streptomyces sp. NPDC058155]|uniref:hypothetical protein n=1 Tax=Streptomyces sp. NPDC058155 TaxID=3346359 RepID=UPI0036EAFFBD
MTSPEESPAYASAVDAVRAEFDRLSPRGSWWRMAALDVRQALVTLASEGRLVGAHQAEELARLESLMGAAAVSLTDVQIEALAAVGNRAVNDAVHEDLCACDAWPKECLSSGGYFQGMWDMGGLETALPAVLGLWEGMRNDRHAAKVDELRAMVADLETQRDRRRGRLVALQNDELNMRGSLSPNGEDRKVPFELGETLTPAVDWLIGRVAELEAEVATANAPQLDRMVDAAATLRAARAEGSAS